MDNLLTKILDTLAQPKSVVLIGATDSGKTYWIQNTLLPHLEALGARAEYLKDGSKLPHESSTVVICDEVETLFDKDFLQAQSEESHYTQKYLNKIDGWYKNYSKLPIGTLFVITRNQPDEIENLLQNFKQADWDNREITVVKFER